MKIKKNDKVLVLSGRDKGRTGTVTETFPRKSQVLVEGINVKKRHHKPSSKYPQGGVTKEPWPILASKLAVLRPGEKKLGTRVGFSIKKDGSKIRVARQAGNKEIK